MQNSIFIAKLIGPVMAAAGLTILINREQIRGMVREVIESDTWIFVSGLATLPLGLAIVNTHNDWSGWPAIITAFGWLAVAAGFTRILLPGPLKALARGMIDKTTLFAVPGALTGLLGLYLSYQGYLA